MASASWTRRARLFLPLRGHPAPPLLPLRGHLAPQLSPPPLPLEGAHTTLVPARRVGFPRLRPRPATTGRDAWGLPLTSLDVATSKPTPATYPDRCRSGRGRCTDAPPDVPLRRRGNARASPDAALAAAVLGSSTIGEQPLAASRLASKRTDTLLGILIALQGLVVINIFSPRQPKRTRSVLGLAQDAPSERPQRITQGAYKRPPSSSLCVCVLPLEFCSVHIRSSRTKASFALPLFRSRRMGRRALAPLAVLLLLAPAALAQSWQCREVPGAAHVGCGLPYNLVRNAEIQAAHPSARRARSIGFPDESTTNVSVGWNRGGRRGPRTRSSLRVRSRARRPGGGRLRGGE